MTRNALVPILKPALTTGPLKDKVQLLVRLQVQPWLVSNFWFYFVQNCLLIHFMANLLQARFVFVHT